MHITLGIDIGTSSVRVAALVTGAWTVLEGTVSSVLSDVQRKSDGTETIATETFIDSIVTAIDGCLKRLPAGAVIDAIGTSCFWHSIIAVDTLGTAQSPILLWSDRRSASTLDDLRKEDPGLPDTTGCPWHTSFAIAKIEWWKRNKIGNATRWLSPTEYLEAELFVDAGGPSTSMASASGCFDQARQRWLPQYEDDLQPVSDTVCQVLKPQYQVRWPKLIGVPWVPGIGDGAAANLGTGCWKHGNITLTVGTSVALRRCVEGDMPSRPGGLWRYQLGRGYWLLGGASSNGGSVWQWCLDTFKFDVNALNHLRNEPSRVVVLPYYSGERAPWWQDHITASISGLTAGTRPEEIVLAHLEAIAVHTSWIAASLDVTDQSILYASGNALQQSSLLAQCLADACNCSLILQDSGEQSLIGAARWAMHTVCGISLTPNAPSLVSTSITSTSEGITRMKGISDAMKLHLHQHIRLSPS